jgi:Glycine-zipper domain
MPRRYPSKTLRHLVVGILVGLALPMVPGYADASSASGAGIQLAQYHPYGPPPGYYGGAPPCRAVNNPWGGAARGAAGGAIIGAIAGNTGRGAAIGAGVGFLGRAVRNSNARANGYCY